MANYSFVIDSSFKPFSFQEMLAPWVMYGNAYEKAEEAYNDLSKKAGDFDYLSKTLPEGSRAREIYEGYANDLKVQAEDLVKNGLNLGNRAALTGLKNRYSSEIGRLEKADAALRAERELRRNMLAKDSSMMFGDENLNIDSFLDNEQPNLYSISGNELYARGAQAGKSASSRIYEAGDEGSTLGGYYRKWVDRVGVSQASIAAFMDSDEVQQQVDKILAERGVTDNFNVDSDNYRKARQSVLNGIYDGIVYQESVKPMRDAGVLSESEQQSLALQRQGLDRQAAAQGLQYDPETKTFKYMGTANDPKYQMWEAQKQWELEHGVLDKKKENSSNKGKNVKGEKWTPKQGMKFNTKDHTASTVSLANNVSLGKKITMAEALEKEPNLAAYDPGFEDHYDYWQNGDEIIPVPNRGAYTLQGNAGGEAQTEVTADDDNNAF